MIYKNDSQFPDTDQIQPTLQQLSPHHSVPNPKSTMHSSLTPILLLAASTFASPLVAREAIITVTQTVSSPQPTPWNDGAVTEYPIHSSCNATLRAQLERGLGEAVKLAQHAKEHLLFWGHDSPFVKKYFGNESTAMPIGWFDRIVSADRAGMVFRCDDPDRNCATQDKWAGHWRGDNATLETVICPRSFEIRRPLEAVCGLGYTVTGSPLNTYWATDLMHRILHVPKISENIVDHYADDYAEVIELAETHSNSSVVDSDTLQYFAIDVYAYDIAAPGVGCHGQEPSPSMAASSMAAYSTAPVSTTAASMAAVTVTAVETATAAATSATPSASMTTSQQASGTTTAPTECHTHADGVVHCS